MAAATSEDEDDCKGSKKDREWPSPPGTMKNRLHVVSFLSSQQWLWNFDITVRLTGLSACLLLSFLQILLCCCLRSRRQEQECMCWRLISSSGSWNEGGMK